MRTDPSPATHRFTDTVCTARCARHRDHYAVDCAECQTTRFALAFLMPLAAVRAWLDQCYRGGEDAGYEAMAERFKVSPMAARMRMRSVLPRLVGESRDA